MAFLRFRLAYIIVAVLRSTALRRVVDGSLDHRRHPHGETSSSLHPGVNTVRPHPSGSGRSVLTPGPHRLFKRNQAPHLWCVAVKRQSEGPSLGRLTGRSTSSPGLGTVRHLWANAGVVVHAARTIHDRRTEPVTPSSSPIPTVFPAVTAIVPAVLSPVTTTSDAVYGDRRGTGDCCCADDGTADDPAPSSAS